MDIMHDLDNDGVRRDNVKARSQIHRPLVLLATTWWSILQWFAMFVRSAYLQYKARNNIFFFWKMIRSFSPSLEMHILYIVMMIYLMDM
jgi:hypothetical protein